MGRLIIGPAQNCYDTKVSAEDLAEHVSEILGNHGYKISAEKITTPDGERPSPRNLEYGLSIPGVPRDRRAIRREIKIEIGRIPVIFEPVETVDRYQQQILDFC
jgi:hypothetical protein